jgi:uncharacterized protein (TIGR02444 family)
LADSKGDSIIDGHFATNPLENPLSNHLDSPLWHYACQVYSAEGVEAVLLALQDDHGADINLILQALWLAKGGRGWTKECIPADYVRWMETQVLPLRQIRRSMKTDWTGYEDFRQQVKKLELKGEQYALALLYLNTDESTTVSAAVNISLAEQNMRTLAEYLGIEDALLQGIATYA